MGLRPDNVAVWIGSLCVFLSMASGQDRTDRIDPALRQIVLRESSMEKADPPGSSGGGGEKVDVLIRTTDAGALRRAGVRVRSEIGEIVTATVPLSLLDRIGELPSVCRIESAAECRPLLDASIPEIGADRVWNGDLGTVYRGENVLVGIYDSGIDWSHPDFIDEEDTSRILSLWDQTSDGAPPSGYDYGSEFDRDDISDELDGITAGAVQGMDTWGHGTHVAGIAAGNGRGTGNHQSPAVYVGVAPEAELIVVKGGDGVFTTDRILDGLSYIFERAEALGRPVAVNLSVGGTHKGPHDGTSLFEQAVDAMLIGYEGRVLVVPAGNDGDRDIHFYGVFSGGDRSDTLRVSVDLPRNIPGVEDFVRFDVWYPVSTDASLTIVTPSGQRLGAFNESHQVTEVSPEGKITVTIGEAGDEEMVVWFSDGNSADELAAGTWQLLFAGYPGWLDGWLYESTMGATLTRGSTRTTLVAEPGNAFSVITMGSYVSRMAWPSLAIDPFTAGGDPVGSLSAFSSPGPTRTRSDKTGMSTPRKKPDLTAPGEYVLSALSSETAAMPSGHYIATDGVHRALRGTSMAAPHGTGVVALMFQADPALTSSAVQGRLIQTAKKVLTGGEWDLFWGYGKLDGYAAVGTVSPVGEDSRPFFPSAFSLSQNYPNPFNGETVIGYDVPVSGTVRIDIHDLSGRRVRTLCRGPARPGRHTVGWDGRDGHGRAVGSGVYFLRMTAGSVRLSRKMILME